MDAGKRQEEQTISNVIPFSYLVKLCERVANAKTNKERLDRLRKFFAQFRDEFIKLYGSLDSNAANGESIFSVVRIICPSRDRERSSYGIKDVVLGRMFARIISVDKDSKDGKMLYSYKNPEIAGSMAGDMGSVIYAVLHRRSSTQTTDGPSVYDLHHVLDQLAKNKDDTEDKVTLEKQIKILQVFVRRLSPLEGKWLAKIILKKMDLGIGELSIFNLIHPKAKELLDITSLEEMCQICNDPDVEYIPTGKVTLFTCFKSMLCVRLNIRDIKDEESEITRKEIVSLSKTNPITLPQPPFLVETKFDGERFQIHFERSASGELVFRYYSRGSHEYKEFKESLTPRLKNQLIQHPRVNSFIIDGEMMAYNYANQNFTTKGQNIDVKTLRQGDKQHCPAFIAWDLVFYNGESVCEKPLIARMDLLKKVLVPKESVYYISDQKQRSSLEEVMELLDESIENCEEGIIIKDRNSPYEPGQRKPTWLKLKPEYVEGCRVNDLDLLIIGGCYADKKRRGGKITSLILGILDGKDVYPLTKVGTGRLKHREMASLVKTLIPNFVNTEIPGIKFKGKRPDVFIDPKKSIILEVNASEINYSKDYALNYCLRFPIVARIRRDKPWNEAMSVKEFHDLRLSCKQGKMVRKREQNSAPGPSHFQPKRQYFGKTINFDELSSGDEAAPSRTNQQQKGISAGTRATGGTKNPKPQIVLSPTKLLAIAAATECNKNNETDEPESNIFQGKVFNAIGSWQWKMQTEEMIRRHGGEIVKNPTTDTFALVAEKETETVKHKKATAKWDILKGTLWIEKCIFSTKILDLTPEDLFFATETTNAKFSSQFDCYGDSFTSKVTVDELKLLLDKVSDELDQDDPDEIVEDISKIRRGIHCEVAKADKDYLDSWYFFSKCKMAFVPELNVGLKACIEFYGGTVLEDYRSKKVTHVIILDGKGSPPRCPVPVLSKNWIYDSVREKKLLDEVPYRIIGS